MITATRATTSKLRRANAHVIFARARCPHAQRPSRSLAMRGAFFSIGVTNVSAERQRGSSCAAQLLGRLRQASPLVAWLCDAGGSLPELQPARTMNAVRQMDDLMATSLDALRSGVAGQVERIDEQVTRDVYGPRRIRILFDHQPRLLARVVEALEIDQRFAHVPGLLWRVGAARKTARCLTRQLQRARWLRITQRAQRAHQ